MVDAITFSFEVIDIRKLCYLLFSEATGSMYFCQKVGCVAVIGSRPREDSERQMPNRRIERAYSCRACIPRSCFISLPVCNYSEKGLSLFTNQRVEFQCYITYSLDLGLEI